MISKTECSTRLDVIKWIVISLLLVSGILISSHFSHIAMAIRFIGWLFLMLVIFAIAFKTQVGCKIWNFIQEALTEMRKVVWPTRQETIHTTLVVIAMVIVAALFLWAIDSLFLWLMSMLTGQRG